MFWDDAHLSNLLQGLCTGQDKLAAGVVFEGLRPQRVAVDIANDHDVFVAFSWRLVGAALFDHSTLSS